MEVSCAQIGDLLHASSNVEYRGHKSIVADYLSGIPVDRFQDVFRMYPGSLSILFAGFGESGFAQERAI